MHPKCREAHERGVACCEWGHVHSADSQDRLAATTKHQPDPRAGVLWLAQWSSNHAGKCTSRASGAKGNRQRQPQSTCNDRTPRVSSGPESAARKERPALVNPEARRPACQRGTGERLVAMGEDKRQSDESLPPGALGGCFDGWRGLGFDSLPLMMSRDSFRTVKTRDILQSIFWARREASPSAAHPWPRYCLKESDVQIRLWKTFLGLRTEKRPRGWRFR